MKKTAVLAMSAVVALTVAACGDDDGGDAGDDTTASAPAEETSDDGAEESDPATTDGADAPDESDDGAGEAGGEDVAVAADCETFNTFFGGLETEALNTLQAGDEITDEHRDEIDSFLDQLDGLDLQTDGAEDLREFYVELMGAIRGADMLDEETQQIEASQAADDFSNTCAAGPGS